MRRVAIVIFAIVTLLSSALRAADALDVNGIVTDEFGKPIAGATVQTVRKQFTPHTAQFTGVSELASVKSGADGRFTVAATSLCCIILGIRLRPA